MVPQNSGQVSVAVLINNPESGNSTISVRDNSVNPSARPNPGMIEGFTKGFMQEQSLNEHYSDRI
jgi:hypothetical protein